MNTLSPADLATLARYGIAPGPAAEILRAPSIAEAAGVLQRIQAERMAAAGGRGCHLNSIDFADLAAHILSRLSVFQSPQTP